MPLYFYQNISAIISEIYSENWICFFEELLLFLKADGKDKVSKVVCKLFYLFLFTSVSQWRDDSWQLIDDRVIIYPFPNEILVSET